METFGIVVIAITVAGAVVAALTSARAGGAYRELGRGALSLDEPRLAGGPRPGTPAWRAEAELELRQLLEAKAARAEARGERPIDVERELARLAGQLAGEDSALRVEARELVIASNERRARRGQPLLDVEAEIERRLRDARSL